MKAIVNDPQEKYHVSRLKTTISLMSLNDLVYEMDINSIYYTQGMNKLRRPVLSKKPQKKLSALRGKMTPQSEKDLNEQILNLRNEWERDI